MSRFTTCLTIISLLWLANCQIVSIIRPDGANITPKKPSYDQCDEEDINPVAFRNLPDNRGIYVRAYKAVLEKNRACIKEQGSQNQHNYQAAISANQKNDDAFEDGLKWGAIGVFALEVLAVILYFL